MTRIFDLLRAYAEWLVVSVSYWIRPYDMLADQRRWRWQEPQQCGRYYPFIAELSAEVERFRRNLPWPVAPEPVSDVLATADPDSATQTTA